MSSTVNPQEMALFSSMASTWWDERGPYRALHQMNPHRIRFIREEVERHFEGVPFQDLSVLDVGCGGGLLCEPLGRLGFQVTGVDSLEENITAAQDHAQKMGLPLTYLATAIENMDTPPFDIVTCVEVLEHVDEVDLFIAHLNRVLKPGGLLILSTLNQTWQSKFLGICVAENILKWAPKGAHHFEKFITPESLAQKVAPHNLTIQSLKGLSYSLLHRDFLLDNTIEINYIASLSSLS